MHLARVLKSAGQPARSAEVYGSVLQLQPHHPTAHYKLGSVLRHMGKHEAAAEAYRCVWRGCEECLGFLRGLQRVWLPAEAVRGQAGSEAAVSVRLWCDLSSLGQGNVKL
jgi:hypothetical protein